MEHFDKLIHVQMYIYFEKKNGLFDSNKTLAMFCNNFPRLLFNYKLKIFHKICDIFVYYSNLFNDVW